MDYRVICAHMRSFPPVVIIEVAIAPGSNELVSKSSGLAAYIFDILKQQADLKFICDTTLDYGPIGNPILISKKCDLFISISYAGGHIYYAISNSPIGLDAEMIHGEGLYTSAMNRVFSLREQYIHANLSKDLAALYEMFVWTRKEAHLKLHGRELSKYLDKLSDIEVSASAKSCVQFVSFLVKVDVLISICFYGY